MSDFKVVSLLNPAVVIMTGGVAIAGGTQTQTSGTVFFSNANGVSFGLSNGTMTASAVGGGGAGDGYNILAAGTQTANTTGSVLFVNGGGVSFGMSNNSVISATVATNYMASNQSSNFQSAGAYLTTAAQSNHSHNFATTTTGGSNVVVGTANSVGATIGVPPFITTYVAQTTQTQAAGNLAGVGYSSTTQAGTTVGVTQNTAGLSMAWPPFLTTYAGQTNQTAASGNIAGVGTTFAGANVSGSMTLNSAGLNLSLSAPTPGGGAAVNFSAGTTSGNLQSVVFSNLNGVSFGLNGSVITASAAGGGGAGTGYTSTTQAGSTVGITNNSNGLSAAWPPFLTTYAQSVQTQAAGNIAGGGFTSTTVAGVVPSATLGTNGLSFAVPNWITTYVAQTNQTAASGNIAGVGTTFAGTNVSGSMTLNSAGLNLALSAPTPGGGGAINISAGATSNNLQTIVFSNSNGVSFGLNGSTVTASVVAGGGGAAYSAFLFQPEVYGNTLMSTLSTGTVYFRPFEPGGYIDADKYMLQQSLVSLTSTRSLSGGVSGVINTGGTGSWGMTGTMALYHRADTNEAGVSYNSINSFDSKTFSIGAGYTLSQSQSTNASSATVSYSSTAAVSYIGQIDGNGGFTTTFQSTSATGSFSSTSTAAGTFGSSIVMAAPYSYLSGIRPVWVPASGTALPPGEYWMGYQFQTTTGSTGSYSLNAVAQISLPSMLFYTASTNNYLEIGNSVPFTTSNWRPGFGSLSASSLTTGNIALSQLSNMASNASLYFAIQGQTK